MVKYPYMRQELINIMQTLSDKDYQRRAWVNQIFLPPTKYDNFDYAVSFLYDDACLADAVDNAIGSILVNEHEAVIITHVIQALEGVFAALGMDATDTEYIECPEWVQVIHAATDARRVLQIYDS